MSCFVQTWDDVVQTRVCVRVELAGQRVPCVELASLSRVVGSLPTSQLPLSCQGGSPTLVRVLNDNHVDGRHFIVSRNFTEEMFLQYFQETHQADFGALEVISMVYFLMLRPRGALQEPWMEVVPMLRRCVVAGYVSFQDLRSVMGELLSIWDSVCEFVHFSGPRHIKCEADRVKIFVSLFSKRLVFRVFSSFLPCFIGL